MSNEWEQYRDRFAPERLETYEAYVDVWGRDADAERKYVDWITFALCADAEMSKVRSVPDLVRQAEMLMSRNGYRLSASGGRRWLHTKGEVRTTSSTAGRTAAAAAKQRSARKPATPRVAAPKKAAPPPKPPPRPTHVECPNDPGMMVPLTGSCMCGWSPSDPD